MVEARFAFRRRITDWLDSSPRGRLPAGPDRGERWNGFVCEGVLTGLFEIQLPRSMRVLVQT